MLFMILKNIVCIIFAIGFVSALGVNLDCPDSAGVDEEFECGIEVLDGEGVYDLKIEIEGGRATPLRIWDEVEGWKSGWYYLIDFIESERIVKLKILESGDYSIDVKLRDEDAKVFDGGRISVGEGVESVGESEEENVKSRYVKEEVVSVTKDSVSASKENDVIVLGEMEEDAEDKEDWDYVSKDGVVIDWLPYAFCLFLIFLVGVLIWSRRA